MFNKMTSVIANVFRGYDTMIAEDKNADPRTKDFFLISNPISMLIIMVGYLYFCNKAGPRFMKDRKPYELKNTILVYNFVQVLLSTYMVIEGVRVWINYNWFCEPIDYSVNPLNIRTINLCWVYFFAKITELLDTVFFILRKKYNQVSFLHLFHHTLMPTISWIGVRYFAGGHGTMFGVINSFVHIIMYSYYLIAGLGPQYQKYLWWKKHLTTLQLIQFSIIFVHNMLPLFSAGCGYPKILHVLFLFFSSCFLFLFGKFYVDTYIIKPKQKLNKQH